MALFTTYSDENKVTDQALVKRYMTEGTVRMRSGVEVTDWKITRYCSKRYRYVGMTEAAARSCAADKIQMYTRQQLIFASYSPVTGDYTYGATATCQADVAPTHDDGMMWHCDISVNETDVTYYKGTNPPATDAEKEALFGISCDYDE